MAWSIASWPRHWLAACLLALPLPSLAADVLDKTDQSFLRGLFDQQWVAVRYDKLALTRASTPEARAFARSELDMYGALGEKMRRLDQQFGLTEAPGGLGILATLQDGQKHDDNTRIVRDDSALLGGLHGAAFDREYALRVVLMHQRMIRHDIREIQAPGANPQIIGFARDMLSVLNDQTEKAGNLYSGQPNSPAGPPPA